VAAPPAPSSMRAAASSRTPASLHAPLPSAAAAPNSVFLRRLCAAPLESAVCPPPPSLEDEGKLATVFNYDLYRLVNCEYCFLDLHFSGCRKNPSALGGWAEIACPWYSWASARSSLPRGSSSSLLLLKRERRNGGRRRRIAWLQRWWFVGKRAASTRFRYRV
jgi:hypothetical protein